ncbi:hypothetical protein [Rhizobium mongolense]|uniref:Uncharacterized protein n=1 Tax=Rhizobium mongolense TaxID=57676 RepID=A0A7W6RHW3_9HYPH|nr:hypothetical protein [Rhizobium mongolense]MBB4272771.1 hypothetical protein [Rhizobium mongolense]
MRISDTSRPVHGYGLMIYSDGEKNVCGFLDGSPVLVPTGVGKEDDRRRFRFSEGERELRTKGDIFCADMGTAGFVRQAINEKLERDRDAANAFRIVETHVSRRRRYEFLNVSTVRLQTGDIETLGFTLEAPSYEVQQEGRREFGQLLDAVGLTSIDDSNELHGLTATFEIRNGDRVFKRWAA